MKTTFAVALLAGFALAQNCQRITVRKEVYDVTDSEWNMIIDTIQKAQTTRDPNSRGGLSIWEEAANQHNVLASRVHWSCTFYPWHRIFMVDVERKLQQINPDFFFPYWDSAREWDRADASLVWQKFGRNGNPITGDIFGGRRLRGHDGSALKRGFETLNRRLVSRETYNEKYQRSLTEGGFEGWAQEMEVLHGTLHIRVGERNSQMSGMFSPLDPVFYLHHGHLDYLWVVAQAGWTANGLPLDSQFRGATVDGTRCNGRTNLPGYNNDFRSVIELNNLCVRYANPGERPPQPTSTTPTPTAIVTSTVIATSSSQAPSTTSPAAPSSSVGPLPTTSPIIPSSSVATTSSVAPSTTPVEPSPSTSSSVPPTVVPGTSTSATPAPGTTTTSVPAPSSSTGVVTTAGPNPIDGTSSVFTTTINPTQTQTTQIPQPTSSYDYGKDYTRVDTCFEPLPEEWLAMNEKGSKNANIRQVQERLLNICKQTVEKVKKGEEIAPMPIYKPEERPIVVEPAPKPVEPQPDYKVLSSGNRNFVATSLFGLALFML
jgi:tyrosinase